MNYVEIYSNSNWLSEVGLISLPFLVIGLFYLIQSIGRKYLFWRAIFIFIVIFIFIFFPYLENNFCLSNCKNDLIIEGVVERMKFIPMEGKGNESFCIRTQCFFYSNYKITGGFNKTRIDGSPIKEGMELRVTYRWTRSSGAVISKIEEIRRVNHKLDAQQLTE